MVPLSWLSLTRGMKNNNNYCEIEMRKHHVNVYLVFLVSTIWMLLLLFLESVLHRTSNKDFKWKSMVCETHFAKTQSELQCLLNTSSSKILKNQDYTTTFHHLQIDKSKQTLLLEWYRKQVKQGFYTLLSMCRAQVVIWDFTLVTSVCVLVYHSVTREGGTHSLPPSLVWYSHVLHLYNQKNTTR